MLDRERGWSVSFAGCGFLGVYHIGAATCLQQHAPHIIRDARHIYGASAGALAGAVLVGGGSLAEACADVLALAKEARKRNLGPLHPSFNVIKIIRDGLMKNLPENTHQLSSGRLCISLTRVSDGKNALISNFDSKEEVVQALICSSFVPIYCGIIPPSFRGVVLGEICEQGYSDALKFLRENGMLPLYFFEKKNGYPLALQEACQEQSGFYAQVSKLFPVRVMSYLMLPYTLPVESAYSLALRLVNWFPDIPDDVRWMQEQLCQIAGTVYSRAKSKLFCLFSLDQPSCCSSAQFYNANTLFKCWGCWRRRRATDFFIFNIMDWCYLTLTCVCFMFCPCVSPALRERAEPLRDLPLNATRCAPGVFIRSAPPPLATARAP
uniref:Patatin-like phospholipase domain-containing protein 2 n=1 Tax=Nothoprocta perdicaria TaxID=30464 RepID=A0A8C6Z5D5_NOTPE